MKRIFYFIISCACTLLAQSDGGSIVGVRKASYTPGTPGVDYAILTLPVEASDELRQFQLSVSVAGTRQELTLPTGQTIDLLASNQLGIEAEAIAADPDTEGPPDPLAGLPNRIGVSIDPSAPAGAYVLRVYRPAGADAPFQVVAISLNPSGLTMSVDASAAVAPVGSPITITATLKNNGSPVLGATVQAKGNCFTSAPDVTANLTFGTPLVDGDLKRIPVSVTPQTSFTGPLEWTVSQNLGTAVELSPRRFWSLTPVSTSLIVQLPSTQAITASNLAFTFFKGTAVPANSSFKDDGVAPDSAAGDGVYTFSLQQSQAAHCLVEIEASDAAGSWQRYDAVELKFAPRQAAFVGFSDYSIDTDGDGFLDQIGVAAQLNVLEAGTFDFWVDLERPASQTVEAATITLHAAQFLNTGTQTITAFAQANDVRDQLNPGSYRRLNARVLSGDPAERPFDYRDDAGSSRVYTASEFKSAFSAAGSNLTMSGVTTSDGPGFDALRVQLTVGVNELADCRFGGTLIKSISGQKITAFQSSWTPIVADTPETVNVDLWGIYLARALPGPDPIAVTLRDAKIFCSARSDGISHEFPISLPSPGPSFRGSDFKNPPPDFFFNYQAPYSFVVTRGQPGVTFDFNDGYPYLTVRAENLFQGQIVISFRNLPTGLSAQLITPNEILGSKAVRFALEAQPSATPGPATFTVAATSGSVEKTINVTVQIQ